MVGQRGRAELIVRVDGRSSHSSRPDLDVNAVEAMADVLRAARELSLPSHAELGQAILVSTDVISRPFPALSVLPDRCTATFDRRTLPGEDEDEVVRQLQEAVDAAVAPHGATGTVEIGLDRFDAYTGAPVEARNIAAAWYTGTDDPALAHRVDEHIELSELHAGARRYATLAAALSS